MFGPTVNDALHALLPREDTRAPQLLSDEELARHTGARKLLGDLTAAIDATLADGKARGLDLMALDAPDLELIEQVLREGEVSIRLGEDTFLVQETALTGVWRIRGTGLDRIEVGEVPAVVREAARDTAELTTLPAPDALPEGAMNVMPVLSEIRDRAAEAEKGASRHEINLTLLPMTPDDLGVLKDVLGVGPVDALSRGYGNCRVTATAVRHVWALNYYNSEDKMILHTIQVGDVPDAVTAAPEDLEESASRLAEIISAYFPADA